MITATVMNDFITISTISYLYNTMKGDNDVGVGFSPSLSQPPLAVRLPSMAAIRDNNSLLSAWSWATVSSNVVTEVSIGSGTWVAFQAAAYSVLQVAGVRSATSIPRYLAASSVVIFVNVPLPEKALVSVLGWRKFHPTTSRLGRSWWRWYKSQCGYCRFR